jgi:alpha-mannosidase
VLARLDREPALAFHLDGQMAIVDDYLEVRSDARPAVARLAAGGRLTLGPWYVLADELLAGDEPLVRNLLLGRRRAAALGGWLAVGYSPDAFGHPATLPAILRGFGIDAAVLWRGYGGEPGQERDRLRWRSPDGSEVLAFHLPPAGYEYGANLPRDPEAARRRWAELRAMLEPRAGKGAPLLVMNGADHHALQPDLVEAVEALRAAAAEYEIEIGTLRRYFEHPALPTARCPAVQGELRWSYRYTWTLQDVHATRSRLKQHVAEGAALLTRWAEPQAALAAAAGGADRRPLLEAAWRTHLLNLSHDVLAGSVADPVADEAAVRARQVTEQARGILNDSLLDRLGQDPTAARRHPDRWTPSLVVVNPSPTTRGGVVEATVTLFRRHVTVGRPSRDRRAAGEPTPPAFRLVAPDGTAVPMQVLDSGRAHERLDSARDYPDQDEVWAVRVAALVGPVPALGSLRLAVEPLRGPDRAPDVPPFPDDLLRLPLPILASARDEGDAYTFQPVPGDRPVAVRWGRPSPVWEGPLVTATAWPFRLGDRARGTLYRRCDAGSRVVRYTVEGVNLRGNHRMWIAFPTDPATDATADMPYGPVTRPPVTFAPADFIREWPAATAPMHRYVGAGGRTVFARGLHQYELHPDGAIAVTLFRSVGDLSRGDLAARPGHAGWPTPTPGAQELGPFRVELAVAPAAAREGDPAAAWAPVERAAEEFHAPLAGRMVRWGINVPERLAGPELVGDGLAFKSLKPREDGTGTVLRCVNLTAGPVDGAWRWPGAIGHALRARLDETVLEEMKLGKGGEVRFRAEPREIVTVIVES